MKLSELIEQLQDIEKNHNSDMDVMIRINDSAYVNYEKINYVRIECIEIKEWPQIDSIVTINN
jgi:hypothetical protein